MKTHRLPWHFVSALQGMGVSNVETESDLRGLPIRDEVFQK
jgi:hypothetical protein